MFQGTPKVGTVLVIRDSSDATKDYTMLQAQAKWLLDRGELSLANVYNNTWCYFDHKNRYFPCRVREN